MVLLLLPLILALVRQPLLPLHSVGLVHLHRLQEECLGV